MKPLEILLLCDMPDRVAATVFDHINALVRTSRHQVRPLSILGEIPAALDLSRFDAIVLHYTLFADADHYLSPSARVRLAGARATKAAIIQDEYRSVDRTIGLVRTLGADIVFTCVPEAEIEKVYPAGKLPNVEKINVLTGYVEQALLDRRVLPIARRPIDVGYRGRMVPVWLGDLGQEKSRIGARFLADAAKFGLKCDISCREEDRRYGKAWVQFVARCKAMLGVESGSSIVDFTGKIQAAIERDLRANPGLQYEALREQHLRMAHGRVELNQISPRCFEAAALRTLMILYEGKYSGRLEAWRHYVPLKKDHSNMAEIVAVVQDHRRAQDIVDRAYREVALAPENSYAALLQAFDSAIAERHARGAVRAGSAYSDREFAAATRSALRTVLRRYERRTLTYFHLLVFRYALAGFSADRRDAILARLYGLLRPVYRFLFR
jgi:hypothetical protein